MVNLLPGSLLMMRFISIPNNFPATTPAFCPLVRMSSSILHSLFASACQIFVSASSRLVLITFLNYHHLKIWCVNETNFNFLPARWQLEQGRRNLEEMEKRAELIHTEQNQNASILIIILKNYVANEILFIVNKIPVHLNRDLIWIGSLIYRVSQIKVDYFEVK